MSEPKTAEVKVVPVEPTLEMANAAVDATGAGSGMSWVNRSPQSLFAAAWSAMLAASPPAETGDGEAVGAVYAAALDTLRKGAPGLSDVTRMALARSINMKAGLSAQTVSPSEGGAVAWRFRNHPENGWVYTGLGGRHPGCEVQPLYTHPASDQSDTERMRAWDWLGGATALELSHGCPGEPEDPGAWMVHRVNGGINDREWTLIATGETPLDAVLNARAALAEKVADQ